MQHQEEGSRKNQSIYQYSIIKAIDLVSDKAIAQNGALDDVMNVDSKRVSHTCTVDLIRVCPCISIINFYAGG